MKETSAPARPEKTKKSTPTEVLARAVEGARDRLLEAQERAATWPSSRAQEEILSPLRTAISSASSAAALLRTMDAALTERPKGLRPGMQAILREKYRQLYAEVARDVDLGTLTVLEMGSTFVKCNAKLRHASVSQS